MEATSNYRWVAPDSTMCMVDANLDFSNYAFSFGRVSTIYLHSTMRNDYIGILIDQRSGLDWMQYVVKRRRVLLLQVPESTGNKRLLGRVA